MGGTSEAGSEKLAWRSPPHGRNEQRQGDGPLSRARTNRRKLSQGFREEGEKKKMTH